MSKEINLPPFYVGQKVVRIITNEWGKEGDEHIVYGMYQCKKCKTWHIDIGKKERYMKSECAYCDYVEPTPDDIDWYSAKSFAPIQENFQSISLEKVLEQETKLIGVN